MKVLLVTHDPGGANAVIPVAQKLQKNEGIELSIYASSFSVKIWQKTQMPFQEIDNTLTPEDIENFLSKEKPTVIFTGTSDFNTLENYFWRVAKNLAIPTYAVLDHWTSYKSRFVRDGVFGIPDFIFTMDQTSKDGLMAANIPGDQVLITGQPHFEQFTNYQSDISTEAFCSQMNWPAKKIITYISSPLEKSAGKDEDGKPFWGYDEKTTLKDFAQALQNIDQSTLDNIQIIIKLHPKEDLNKFDEEFKQPMYQNLDLKVIKEVNNKDLLFHSHLVVSTFSMMAFEAFLMNKPTLFIQLNAKKYQKFGDFDINIIDNYDDLVSNLEQSLISERQTIPSNLAITSASSLIIEHLTEQVSSQ